MGDIIAKIGKSKYQTTIITDGHTIIADEPKPYGKDLGPNPYDFLLIALGSCVAMTLRMYADRKQWDLREVEVHLSQERVYHKDCENCVSDEGYVHIITKKLKFIGNLDDSQRAKLIEISDKCPVNKTLQREIIINTEQNKDNK